MGNELRICAAPHLVKRFHVVVSEAEHPLAEAQAQIASEHKCLSVCVKEPVCHVEHILASDVLAEEMSHKVCADRLVALPYIEMHPVPVLLLPPLDSTHQVEVGPHVLSSVLPEAELLLQHRIERMHYRIIAYLLLAALYRKLAPLPASWLLPRIAAHGREGQRALPYLHGYLVDDGLAASILCVYAPSILPS